MADYATKQDVQEIVSAAVTKAVDDLSQVILSFSQHVDERFTVVEQRLDGVDQRLDGVERRLDGVEESIVGLNKKYDHLIETLDAFLKRLDDHEADNAARDAQIARLERWIEQIASKTGIKLEY